MRRFSGFSLLLLLSAFSLVKAQVNIVIDAVPANTPADAQLYIAGDFTGWNPGSAAWALHLNDSLKWEITLPQRPEGTAIQFKFTRGSWETVEKGNIGEEIPNRTFTFGNGQVIHVNVLNWADNGSGGGSTAAANVSIMATAFAMPQLNRTRTIRLYLPPDYQTSGKRYPVLYMHDGQNLFDVLTSFSGEWQVDEALNTLAGQGFTVPIVVGIDNGGVNRLNEYSPWRNASYGGGQGDAYMRFITETLKPYMDANYRTLTDRDNTAIMGSSMGGLISFYGILQYQQIFSKAGLFSSSFWFNDSTFSFPHLTGINMPMRLYQLCGTDEGGDQPGDMMRMNDSLRSAGLPATDIANQIVAGGQHNEALWRNHFTEAIRWLFGFNAPGIAEPAGVTAVICYPNPVVDKLSVQGLNLQAGDTVQIFDISGKLVANPVPDAVASINTSQLTPGLYIISIIKGKQLFAGRFEKK